MPTVQILLPLALILVAARLAGKLSQRVGMPAVLGELLAGVVLGPSLLGLIQMNEILAAVAEIGVLLLMFIAGLETDLDQMRRVGKASLFAAASGVIFPFLGGLLVGELFGLDLNSSLFLAAVLTATSVSISAQTLHELGRLRSKEGLITLGAAIIDDVLGILVLSLVLSLSGQGGSPGWAILRLVLFFPIAIVAGVVVLRPLVRWINEHHAREAGFALIMALVLVYAWAAESLGGLAAITGAYLAGILLGRIAGAREWVTDGAAFLGYGLFVPVFFVTVGLQANISAVRVAPLLAAVVIVVAIVTKAFGAGLGARLGGCTWPQTRAVGAGMIARGEVALVMATLGLSSGLLDNATYTVVILMTLATTLVTPLLLKLVIAGGEAPADSPLAPLTPVVSLHESAEANSM